MSERSEKKSYKCNKNLKKKIKKKEKKCKKDSEITLKNEDMNELVEYPSCLENIEEFKLKDGFERFSMDFEDESKEKEGMPKLKLNEDLPRKAIAAAILESNHVSKEFEDGEKMSKKRWKKLNRISIGDLKIKVKKPDLVEPWDNCSRDPIFLLELKAKRNTVPVPRHWCATGKYLQGKRGFVKPPFKLPDFIAKTGIVEMRQTADDKDSDKSLKNKMKDKIRPKVGVVDISYEKLYNAFFLEQTKPELTKFGDIYYQGKELEAKRKESRPGILSDELRIALGMTIGPNSDKVPPPWLISQQRYGPPPSYPNLKIPGLNKGLPPGCSFGYHIGGWGKPPVDDDGKPLYGDVFANAFNTVTDLIDIDAEEDDDKYWGEIESNGEESDNVEDEEKENSNMDEDDDEEDGEADSDTETTVPSNKITEVVNNRSGASSVVNQSFVNNPDIELRKRAPKTASEDTETKDNSHAVKTKPLFQVLPEVKASIGQNIVGSEKVYSLSNSESKIQLQKRKNDTVEKAEPKVKKHKEFKF